MTTKSGVYFLCVIQFLIVSIGSSCAAVQLSAVPHFRHVDVGAALPTDRIASPVKLLTDENFAPYSFRDASGHLVGIAVDSALQACAAVHLTCEIKPMPFVELLPALLRGDGDAVISGLRIDAKVLESTTMTRPYFFSSARFVTRVGMPFENPDIRTLAGRRIGFVKATSHQQFLEKYFDRSALTPFASENEMFEALRTGKLDAGFTDSIHAIFWLNGTASRNCCVPLGNSFVDRETFSRGLTIVFRQDHETLREYFDFALDRLDESGEARKIFQRYLPSSPL